MFKKTPLFAALAAATSLLIASGCAATDAAKPAVVEAAKPAKPDYTKMTPVQLANYLVLESGSFDLKQPTQEGTTGRERLVQDDIQRICSTGKGATPSDADLDKVRNLAAASIKYPEGGIKLGDWKKGRELAWSGFGYRTAHQPDDHSNREAGGNCYNCHQLATDRTGGNIGPELTRYGKDRGVSPEILKYTYDVIYNPHAYFACTNMPRMGAAGVLNPQQIADIMA
jgi:L-cysteine S-thiosulfotransferase